MRISTSMSSIRRTVCVLLYRNNLNEIAKKFENCLVLYEAYGKKCVVS